MASDEELGVFSLGAKPIQHAQGIRSIVHPDSNDGSGNERVRENNFSLLAQARYERIMSLARIKQPTGPGIVPRRRSACVLWGAILVLLFGTLISRAAMSETEVKAAFLYNFAKFVEWPAEAFSSETAPIQLAVLGDEDVTAKLKMLLSDKKAHGRS